MVPWALLFCVPLLFGLRHLFPWAAPDTLSEQTRALLAKHGTYFSRTAFVLRACGYVGLCFALLWMARRRAAAWTGPGVGMMVYVFTAYLLGVDWVMSLEPGWYSTGFPVIFMAGQALSALAFCIAATIIAGIPGETERKYPAVWKDLGNLLLGALMFWAYVAYSQFLVVWSGNLPTQAAWYLHRNAGGWHGLLIALAGCNYFFLSCYCSRTSRNAARAFLRRWRSGCCSARRFIFIGPSCRRSARAGLVFIRWTRCCRWHSTRCGCSASLASHLPGRRTRMFKLLLRLPLLFLAFVGWLFFPERSPAVPIPPPPAPDPDAPSEESRKDGHEVSDASPKVIGLFVLGLFAMIFTSMAALGWMYIHLYSTANAIPVKPQQDSFKYGPRDKTSIARDWTAIDKLAHARLDGYGWTDRAHGVVRVPIARAVDLVAREGLPARAGQTPYFPPPDQEKLPLMDLETNADATKFDPH